MLKCNLFSYLVRVSLSLGSYWQQRKISAVDKHNCLMTMTTSALGGSKLQLLWVLLVLLVLLLLLLLLIAVVTAFHRDME